jgi:putative endonuclease
MPPYPPRFAVRAGLELVLARMTVSSQAGSKTFCKMYTVYVLKDEKGKLYKGMTNNLQRRLSEHRSGHTITTSKMKGLEVVYIEKYDTFTEARKRELYLKSAAGRKFLNKILPP